jgi:hypothetical protein
MEIVDAARARPALFDEALERWGALVGASVGSERIHIFESTLFQTTLHPLLLAETPAEKIIDHMTRLSEITAPLDPSLVWLEPGDVAQSLSFAMARRGEWFREFLETLIASSPYGRTRALTGLDGVVRYFQSYLDIVHDLTDRVGFKTLVIERSRATQDESMRRVMAFLGDSSPVELRADADNLDAYVGRYKDAKSEDVYLVVSDGARLYLEDSVRTLLIPKGDGRFEVEGTCVAMRFHSRDNERMQSLECTGNLPNLSREWARIESGCDAHG